MSKWLNHVEAASKLKIDIQNFFNAVEKGFIEGLQLAPHKYVFEEDHIHRLRRRMIIERYQNQFPV